MAGTNRADNAVVKINGIVVAGADQFKKKQRQIVVTPIGLGGNNTVEVELRSAPGTQILVMVGPAEEK